MALITGAIHHDWQPPWMTSAARKNPTRIGLRSEISFWWWRVAMVKARKNRKPPTNNTGKCAVNTVHVRNIRCTTVTHEGIGVSRSSHLVGALPSASPSIRSARRSRSLRKYEEIQQLELTMTTDRRLPSEVLEHEGRAPLPLAATISTGGAAKFVSVPPIEMLTNNRPSVP